MKNVVLRVLRQIGGRAMAVILFIQELYLFGGDVSFKGACAVARANTGQGRWPLLSWTRRELDDDIAALREEIQTIKREDGEQIHPGTKRNHALGSAA